MLEVGNEPVVQPMVTGTYSNKNFTAHIGKRAENPDVLNNPTVKVSNSNDFDNTLTTKISTINKLFNEDTRYKIFECKPSKNSKISRAPLSNSKSFERTTLEKNFVIPQKPTRGLERQVAQGSTTNPNWSQPNSEENTHLKSFLPENLLMTYTKILK